MKDSGQREVHATGAQRDTRTGKGRFDLIAPEFKQRLAKVLEQGALKYGARNWEKGIPLSRSYDSLLRHLNQWAAGESDEDHLAHAACNLMFILATESRARQGRLPADLIDLGPHQDEAAKRIVQQIIDNIENAPAILAPESAPVAPQRPPEFQLINKNSSVVVKVGKLVEVGDIVALADGTKGRVLSYDKYDPGYATVQRIWRGPAIQEGPVKLDPDSKVIKCLDPDCQTCHPDPELGTDLFHCQGIGPTGEEIHAMYGEADK